MAARLAVYDETGHCPNWERPEEAVADITALLRHR
jgi:pimeloyl-ACP methyl ester carboxylesterase